MDPYEAVLVRLFEHCGFAYDPGPLPEPDKRGGNEVVGIPYAEFQQHKVPGYWLRSVALHLGDTRRAADDVSQYLGLIGRFVEKGEQAMPEDWLEEHLPVTVSDDLRAHVFWFLTYSETIRDHLRARLEDAARLLVPAAPRRRYVSRVPIETVSRYVARLGSISCEEAEWTVRQLAKLDIHARITRDALDELTSVCDGHASALVHAFSNVQRAMLDVARVLLEADYAADLWGRCTPALRC